MASLEFQPVVLAAGRGSRISDISAKIPKALLPIGNLPMIVYPLQMLDNYGFDEAIVIVLKSQRSDIENALRTITKEDFSKLKRLDYVSVPDEEDWGTADSLRHIKDKIKSDVLVISCDLIADIPLYRVADLHRAHSATVTALFSSQPEVNVDTPAPGTKSKKKTEQDFIGLEEKSDRLLFLSSATDFDETIDIPKRLLKKHPCIDFHSRLTDAHLYLLSKSVIDLLPEVSQLTSLKGELIPYLIKLQYQKRKTTNIGAAQKHIDILEDRKDDDLFDKAHDLSSWNDHHGDMEDSYHGNKVRCYGHVMEGKLCIRANTLANYSEVNRQITKNIKTFFPKTEQSFIHPTVVLPQKTQIGPDSMIGEATRVSDKVSIKKSMIGPHCHLAEKVRITNSIIMDHVTIGEGCNIQNSIICRNAHIGEKSELKDTIVGSAQNVNALSKFTNDVIMDLDQMMEI